MSNHEPHSSLDMGRHLSYLIVPMMGMRLRSSFLLFSFFASLAGSANAQTHSALFQSLEQDSPDRQAFIKAHNESTTASLAASTHYIPVQNLVYQLLDGQHVLDEISLDLDRSLKLIDRGLGKSTDIVLSTNGAADVVLFSNFQLFGITITDEIIGFNLSPDQKIINIIIAKNGSIDTVTVQFYDLVNRVMLPNTLTLAENSIAWGSPTVVFFNQQLSDGTSNFAQFDFGTQTTTVVPDGRIIADSGRFLMLRMNGKQFLMDKTLGTTIPIIAFNPQRVLSYDDSFVYVWCGGQNKKGEIRTFSRTSTTPDAGTSILSSNDFVFRSVDYQFFPNMNTKTAIVTIRNGPQVSVRAYDLMSGTLLAEVPIPSCCSYGGASLLGTQLTVYLYSALVPSSDFTYDLTQKTWNQDPNTVMLTLNSVQYASTIEFATSSDGTQIPVRLTYRADLIKNQQNPVLMHSYGGFGEPGYLDPAYDALSLEFLKRGGILAGPGLRGGNEYDGDWHASAITTNKIKTYQDLNAAALLLENEGWTSPAKMISMGTSNGGLTVAATALLFPNVFGLVIPIAGVHDMLAKDRLDAEFGGWDGEYGSETDPSMTPSLTNISPLENTHQQDNTAFLILDGRDDTRVNIAHSLKLTAALEAETAPHASVNLFSIKDAGHGVESGTYSNMKAWTAETAIWTKIYDITGWTL